MKRAAAVLATLMLWAQPAIADDKDRAVKLLKQGNSLFKKKRYEEALDRYEAAYQAFESPKLFFNLARSHQRLGHVKKAIRYYRRFLKDAGLPRRHPLHRQARVSLRKLRIKLGRQPSSPLASARPASARTASARPASARPASATPASSEPAPPPPTKTVRRAPDEAPNVAPKTAPSPAAPDLPDFAPAHIPAERPTTPPSAPSMPSITEPALPSLRPLQPVHRNPPRRVFIPAVAASRDQEDGVLSQWWFWTALGVAVAGASVSAYVLTQGDGPLPPSELGTTAVRDWERL